MSMFLEKLDTLLAACRKGGREVIVLVATSAAGAGRGVFGSNGDVLRIVRPSLSSI